MREAKFILPLTAGQGAGHEYAKQALLKAFGGYTLSQVEGAWQSPSDGGVEYDMSNQYIVALDLSGGWAQGPNQAFRNIAIQAAVMEQQQAVYVVNTAGDAEIVTLPASKPDRVVEKEPETGEDYYRKARLDLDERKAMVWKTVPMVGDLWRTADHSVVCIVERTLSGKLYGKVLKRGTSGVADRASVGYTDDGKVDMLEPGPHPLHLTRLIERG